VIQLYAKGTTDFSKNGISLRPTESTVTFQDNGQYDLEIVIPAKSEYTSFDYGQILRATVPTQNVAAVELGTVSYYQVINAEGTMVYSEVPTLQNVWYRAWCANRSSVIYAVGNKVTYNGKNYQMIALDPGEVGDPPAYNHPPDNYPEYWQQIPSTIGTPGKVAAELDQGDLVMKTADFNSEYIEAATLDGKQGYIKLADLQATGETEQRTVPARTIAKQNFTITEIRKEQNNQAIRITAEHVSYQLGRTILGDCNVANVTPATALLFIQGAMQEEYAGNLYTNITGLEVTADWSWKNAQAAILDPKNGLLGLTDGWMIRDDLDVFLLEQGTPAPKYAVRYGANMKSVKWTGNVGDIVTRIYPIAKNEDGSTLMLPEKYIDTARTIPFIRPEVLDTKLKVGDTVKNSDGTETTLTQEDVWLEMRNQCYNRFNIDKCDQAEVNLELDWVYMPDTVEYAQYTALENAAPGDWVEVANGPLGISELIRMTGYRWDPMLEKYKSTTFGPNKEKATVAGYSLQNGSVTARAIANNSVGSSAIMANSITAREIEANSITAELIASQSIQTEQLSANAVTANKIAANTITAQEINAASVRAGILAAGKIAAEDIVASSIRSAIISAGKITADDIVASSIRSAIIAAGKITAEDIEANAITAGKIDANDINAINAKLGTATITNGMIANADISFANIKDASVQNLIARDAVTDAYFIDKLQVRNAQMVYATIGELVIKASDNKYYRLDVAADGSVSPTEVTLTAAEIAAGETSNGHAAIIETDLLVGDLAATNMKGISALIDKITASRIDVDELWARDAFIGKLMVQDISSNTYIQSTIGNWASSSTITQTIAGLDSRISSLGYGTVYMQPEEPNHAELVSGDMWVQTLPSGTWEDIYNDYATWQEIYNTFDAWQVIGSIPKVFVWDGQGWQELYDANISSTLETEIQQLSYLISLTATKTEVDRLSGEITTFAATLEIQAQQIEAAVSAVNTKASTYVMYDDPRTVHTVTLGDIWIKNPEGTDTWEAIYDNYASWQEVYNTFDAWKDFIGDETYVWDGEKWILTSDRAEQIDQRTAITETSTAVTILAETTATLQGETISLSAQLTVANDRITQEVQRATTAEGGKISKTQQYQTADEIYSAAVAQAAAEAGGLYVTQTTSLQTATDILTEATRQSSELMANGYLAKSPTYASVQDILDEASDLADAAAVTAKNASIAKSGQLITADAIVNYSIAGVDNIPVFSTSTAYTKGSLVVYAGNIYKFKVNHSAGGWNANQVDQVGLGSSYIAQTEQYQTADMIYSAAKNYADGQLANYSTITQTAEEIAAYVGSHAYGLISGITITAAGVDISGSQYVHIASGGNFRVTTGDFGIKSDAASNQYVLWAGAAAAADSFFRVKKNGEVTLSKLMIVNEQGQTSEFNLNTGGLWKLNYRTVKTLSATTSGGTTTLTLGTSNGDLSVNFSNAASVTLSGAWSGRTYTVTATNGQTKSTEVGFLKIIPSGGETIDTFNASHKAGIQMYEVGGNPITGFIIDATSEYNAGAASVSATGATLGSKVTGAVYNLNVNLSNGNIKATTVDCSSPINSVEVSSVGNWSGGTATIYLTNQKTAEVSMPQSASWSKTPLGTGNLYTIYCTAGGYTYSWTTSF